jgi:phosphoglycolate phosphatase
MSDRKLIVFDFDGTLVNSEPQFAQALEEFSNAKLLPFDIEKMKLGYVDITKNDLGWGLQLHEQYEIFEEYCTFMNDQTITHKRFIPEVFEHVIETLDQLKSVYDLGLVTVRDRATTLATLEFHGMNRFFPKYRTHCCAKERGYGIKPSPDALNCLLDEMEYKPHNVVMIGDTGSDIHMAHGAGAKSIGVSWGLHPSESVRAANPTLMLENIQDLPHAIKTIFSL